jgi:hypothetical protein
MLLVVGSAVAGWWRCQDRLSGTAPLSVVLSLLVVVVVVVVYGGMGWVLKAACVCGRVGGSSGNGVRGRGLVPVLAVALLAACVTGGGGGGFR